MPDGNVEAKPLLPFFFGGDDMMRICLRNHAMLEQRKYRHSFESHCKKCICPTVKPIVDLSMSVASRRKFFTPELRVHPLEAGKPA